MSHKPEFQFAGGEWAGNMQRFATREEATASALARFQAWTMPTDWRVVESGDAPNYARVDGADQRIGAQA